MNKNYFFDKYKTNFYTDKIRLNSRIGSEKKIDALLSNTNTNPNPKINVIAMTKEHQFFYGTDTRGKPV